MAITSAPVDVLPEPGALIGDKVVTDGSGGEYEHVYAATGRLTKRIPLGGRHEIEMAVRAARDVLPAWQAMPVMERRQLLLRAADLIRADADMFGVLSTVDTGNPKVANNAMVLSAAEFLEYNAGWVERVGGEIRPPSGRQAMHAYVRDEPYGVVGAMTPFNAPVIASCMVIGPVLAAGNTIVVKPSELAPYAIMRLGRLFLEAGFPPGVVNFVPGPPKTGEALVRSPGVDKVFFEGSTKSARYVLVAAAESGPKPVALELGGKSPAIVFDDADLDVAVESVIGGGFTMGGQGCILGTRILVQASIYNEFVEQARITTSSIVVGDPFNDGTMMGPVANQIACDRVMGVIENAVEAGQGRMVTGGQRLGGELADGSFISPTLFADVDNRAPIAREEIFGPVLSVIRFETEAEALRLANDSPYGLGAYVHTRDVGRIHRAVAGIEAGSVFANGIPSGGPSPALPFGGVKHSGYGRLGGIEAIREFTRPKTVTIFLG
jgi:aldehyde dehydrogenase (NAD+)